MANNQNRPEHESKHSPSFEGKGHSHSQQSFGQQARDTASSLGQQAKDTASSVKDQASKAMSSAGEKGQELFENARESVSTLEQRGDEAVASVGGQLKTLAGRLRENVPQQGMIGTAAETVASTLESGADYLEEHDLRDIARDVRGLVRSYPIPAVLMGIGVGFLLGRTFRS